MKHSLLFLSSLRDIRTSTIDMVAQTGVLSKSGVRVSAPTGRRDQRRLSDGIALQWPPVTSTDMTTSEAISEHHPEEINPEEPIYFQMVATAIWT